MLWGRQVASLCEDWYLIGMVETKTRISERHAWETNGESRWPITLGDKVAVVQDYIQSRRRGTYEKGQESMVWRKQPMVLVMGMVGQENLRTGGIWIEMDRKARKEKARTDGRRRHRSP
jgi:hypothetical protein